MLYHPKMLYMLMLQYVTVSCKNMSRYMMMMMYAVTVSCKNDKHVDFQLWRYLSYSLVHSGLFHVSFNILVQVFLFIIVSISIAIFSINNITFSTMAPSLFCSTMINSAFILVQTIFISIKILHITIFNNITS